MNPARALYSLVTWCAQPLLRRKLHRRAVAEPGYGYGVGERFGRYPAPIDSLMPHSSTDPLGRFVWIHAVSLGETRAAAILLAELREQLPGMRLLLTHGTATGRAEGEKLLQAGDVQVWQPWDTQGAVSRFLRKFRPAIGILMETEVWPNLVAGCRQRGIPLVLANARFNEKSLRNAQRLAALARPAYGGLAAVWAQTEEDATRLRAIGAPVRGVFGNLKFDVVPDARQVAQGRAWRAQAQRPVVMLASSREGEEAMWLENFKQKKALALYGKALAATKTRAWAPGPGTARALEQAGVPSSSIDGPAPDAPQFDSEALWQQVSAQIQPGDRVLIVRGRSATPQGAHKSAQGSGRDWLARQIEAAGGTVEFVVAYQRGAPQLTDAEVALAHQAAGDGSVWLLSSSEAVAHLGQALPLVDWGAAIALATHPRIAEAARAAGFGTVRECRPALADVVASIESAA